MNMTVWQPSLLYTSGDSVRELTLDTTSQEIWNHKRLRWVCRTKYLHLFSLGLISLGLLLSGGLPLWDWWLTKAPINRHPSIDKNYISIVFCAVLLAIGELLLLAWTSVGNWIDAEEDDGNTGVTQKGKEKFLSYAIVQISLTTSRDGIMQPERISLVSVVQRKKWKKRRSRSDKFSMKPRGTVIILRGKTLSVCMRMLRWLIHFWTRAFDCSSAKSLVLTPWFSSHSHVDSFLLKVPFIRVDVQVFFTSQCSWKFWQWMGFTCEPICSAILIQELGVIPIAM